MCAVINRQDWKCAKAKIGLDIFSGIAGDQQIRMTNSNSEIRKKSEIRSPKTNSVFIRVDSVVYIVFARNFLPF